MAVVGDYLQNRPYERTCDAIPKLSVDLENLAGGLVDLINSLTVSPVSRYPGKVDARLTLESGEPVSTTDQSAKNTVYFTPLDGDVVPLYDPTEADFIDRYLSAEPSLSLVGLGAGTVHDIFANYDTGSSSIVLSREQWATPFTRNIALTTERGIKVKSGALTHRYLGTLSINATGGQCEDTKLQRLLWNMYNRRRREMLLTIDTNAWSWINNTWRAANGDPSLRVECVIGLDEDIIAGHFSMDVFASTTSLVVVGIGLDRTNGNDAQVFGGYVDGAQGDVNPAWYKGHTGIGYHYFQCVEIGNGSSGSFGGDYGNAKIKAGLSMDIIN